MKYVPAFFSVHCALLLTLVAATTVPSFGQENAPIPDEAAQTKALGLVREVYVNEWKAARTSEQKATLAEKLVTKAGREADKTSRFVLLRISRDVAVQAGSAATAMRAIDVMSGEYEIDGFTMKVEALLETAKSATSTAHRKAVAVCGRKLIEAAVAMDEFDTADLLYEAVVDAARSTQEWDLTKQIVARNKEIEGIAKAHEQIQDDLKRLEKSPTDPDANLAVGRYSCFFKGDWNRGLPMLALGSDENLGQLATHELEDVTSPDKQVALGDGWWTVAQDLDELKKETVLRRAGHWYKAAQQGLPDGLMKDRVTARLNGIESVVSPTLVQQMPQPQPVLKSQKPRWIPVLTSPESLGDWEVLKGKPEFVNGWCLLDNAKLYHKLTAKDMVIRAKVRPVSTGAVSLILRNNSAGTYICCLGADRRTVYLTKFLKERGRGTNMKTTRLPQAVGEFTEITFSAIGDTLDVHFNGKRIFYAKDQAFAEGTAGLKTDKGGWAYRDVEVLVLKK